MNSYNPKARNNNHRGAMSSGAARQSSSTVAPEKMENETHREEGHKFNQASLGSGAQTERHYQPTQAPNIPTWNGPKY